MIALIPARGGSKGLPNKNIKLLNGKPLIAYTIEAALQAKEITRVIVSTDYENIKEVALEYGAEIPFLRPNFLATDNSSSLEVFKYTINRLEEEENIVIDNFVVLQPTSPLRTSKHIDEAISLFKEKEAKAVVSYCKEYHSVFWHKRIDQQGKILDFFEGDYEKNRQEIEETYFPNGAIYVFNKDFLFTTKDYNKDCYAYVMDRKHSIDIDTIDDFLYAEFLMNGRFKS
jgi:hypothetical protein